VSSAALSHEECLVAAAADGVAIVLHIHRGVRCSARPNPTRERASALRIRPAGSADEVERWIDAVVRFQERAARLRGNSHGAVE
jgi:hypothetical protein